MSDRTEPAAPRVGAVVFVRQLERCAAFYASLLTMARTHTDAEHAVLAAADFELVVHAIPARYADDADVASPPQPRERTPIKLVWTVESLERCAERAERAGGRVFEHAWHWRGFRIRDGHDPEGNLFQLRQRDP